MSTTPVADGPAPATASRSDDRHLSERRAATVDALVEAGVAELNDTGWDGLTLRSVATRAGVTHTTAYTYFSSKAHLVAEVFRRRLAALPPVGTDLSRPLAERVVVALGGPSLLLADEPNVADAALPALLDGDPDVVRIRTDIGLLLAGRVRASLGVEPDDGLVEAVLLAFSGAMVQAGMGYFSYDGVVRRMERVAGLLDPARHS